MLREIFIGRAPSHFHINKTIQAFIVSEMFFWSSWNFIMPIFAIFAATRITGGSVEVAASGFSAHLISRVIFELVSGRFLAKSTELKKFIATILGILVLSAAYIGFMSTTEIAHVYLYYAVAGVGFGIASPAKYSLFSTHLDKNKEAMEWGIYDAAVFLCMALAAALGGFVASIYGFRTLFLLSAIINVLAVIPYILYIRDRGKGKF